MKAIFQLAFLVSITLCLSACGGSDENAADNNSGSRLDSKASSDSARFSKDIRKKGCEILTAEMVETTFNVPAENLKQMKVMGCMYLWDDQGQELKAHISMLAAHQSSGAAATWFGNATRNRSAEEMQAEMDKVSASLDESGQLGSNVEKSAVNAILGAVGVSAVSFEDVANVGDEARANSDGNVYVRVDNLTFVVSAYQGPQEPEADLAGMNVKEIIAAAKKSSADWMRETAATRLKDGAKLAAAIVEQL